VRTWRAIDDCGNESTCQQTITIVDETAPVLNAPADITIECTDSNEPSTTGEATANDACGTAETSYTDSDHAQTCPYSFNRTWTAVDGCGNVTTAVQVITVEDTVAPTLEIGPAALSIECDEEVPASEATFSDNCDTDLEVSYQETTEAISCGYELSRQWTAIDNCGNTTVHVQVITVSDNTPPSFINAPESAIVECTNIPALAHPSASDLCDDDITVNFEGQEVEGSCPTIMTRTWTATDACGNTSTHVQTITVEDTVAPEILGIPADAEVECSAIPNAPILSTMDDCDDESDINFVEVISGEGCPYTITRTWTATDACGNTSTATQVITVNDTEAPIFDVYEAQLQVQCDEVDQIHVVANDNCDSNVQITFEDIAFSSSCYNTIQRTYIAVDACGNQSAPVVQFLFINDESAPIFVDLPDNAVISCGETPPAAVTPTAIDNCDSDIEITFEESVSGQDCPYVIERTWTANDDCGNSSTHTQTITVVTNVSTSEVITNSYPNPFASTVTMTFVIPEDGFVAYEVYNSVGQVNETVFKGFAIGGIEYQIEVNTDQWTKGVYSAQLIYDADIHTNRLVKE